MPSKQTKDDATPAERQEREAEDAQRAEERREAERDKRADKDGAPPGELEKKGGRTAPQYSRERLIEAAGELFGVPHHALVGALHSDEREYLTVDEARAALDAYLGE